MSVVFHAVTPFPDQKPGTSGLRKKVRVFQQPGYAETFIQAVFDVADAPPGAILVIGGDGRYHNRTVIQLAIRMAVAAGYGHILVGRGGILSTPAVSNLIRSYRASGGLILSASHNPGGPDHDFGIKYNIANGGPAPEQVTDAIFARTLLVERWKTIESPDIDLDEIGSHDVDGSRIEIVDPVQDYANLMETLFDFGAIREAREAGLSMAFDAMNAVTGPYAREILESRLGFPSGTVRRSVPLEDFGGAHPDPNPSHADELYALMMGEGAPDFGAASDGDGDRNLILGRRCFVSPSDSLAILAANARLVPAYADGLTGVARSMPTSCAVDRVAAELGIPCFETPTGWKFFGNLLDAGKVTLCGEESAGTGGAHVREKDGLWAILMWLNILAIRKLSVITLVSEHWQRFGRNHYVRHDYEALPVETAARLVEDLRQVLPTLVGQSFGSLTVSAADSYSYEDPVDGSLSANQGLRILFDGGSRIVYRLSGTGTEGATLRVYLERYEPADSLDSSDAQSPLVDLASAADAIAGISLRTGRLSPDVVT